MLLPLSVYSRRIESQRQPFQAIPKSFVAKLIYFRRKLFYEGRVKITLPIIIFLNLILPAMGSIQPVDEKTRFSSILDRANWAMGRDSLITETFDDNKERGLSLATRKIDRRDYDLFGLARLIKKNGCLLCRIMEHIPQNQGLVGSRVYKHTTSNAGREPEPQAQNMKLFYGEKSNVESQKERTVTTKNFEPKLNVRKRRDTSDRRRRRLFSKAGDFVLRIHPDGRVDGTLNYRSPLGIMKIHSVSMGKIRIQSEATGLFLSMTPSGKLYGSVVYNPRYSVFEEHMTPNKLTTYSMLTKKGRAYVGLSKHGRAKKGIRINALHSAAHFLPLKIN